MEMIPLLYLLRTFTRVTWLHVSRRSNNGSGVAERERQEVKGWAAAGPGAWGP
jgi:hypothetical protein